MFNIIQNRKIWFSFSLIIFTLSLGSLIIWGLNLGIDFTGGSLIEIDFKDNRPQNQEIVEILNETQLSTLTLQPVEESRLLIRTETLTEEKHQQVLEMLKSAFPNMEELRFDSIGPVIGQELKQKAIYAIIIVLIAIIFYIAYAFRHVSKPVESWKYGLSAIIALIHDLAIVTGIFVILGQFYQVQIDSYFVTALLTILGFSVHDTIVTFDRTRENLKLHQDKTFEEVVNLSVNQTIIRSLNTSLTTTFVLLAVLLFGGNTIFYFVLALLIGIIIGTYSSIFLASPLLMVWYRLKKY